MSFSAQQARSFFGPLKGKTSIFLVDGREANLSFAQGVTALLDLTEDGCAILDVDAFYSSNSDLILARLPSNSARSTLVQVPEPGSSIEAEFPNLFGTSSRIIIVDSLNTLYHLLSFGDGSSRSRKLAFAVASLSYLARTDRRAVLLTMYRRERSMGTGGGRSISELSDLTVSVEVRDSMLLMKCERGTAWPEGRFSIQIP